MMFRTVLTCFFVVAFTLSPAWAQGKAAYTVRDVKVDIVSESSVKARNQAFTAAQEKAFRMLSERFLTPDQMAGFKPPSANIISGMVSDFEITSEQLSKKRYLGTYIFRFKENAVYRYFGHGPIAESGAEMPAASLLVIPVFTQKGEAALWDTSKNPWLQAWQKNDNASSGFLVPEGNVSDKMDMRDADISKITQSSLKRMKSRYGVNDVVLLSAVFDQKSADKLKIDIYRTDRGKIEQVKAIPIEIGKATKLGELLNNAVPQIEDVLKGNWKGVAETAYQDPYAISNDPYGRNDTQSPVSAQSQPSAAQPSMAGQIRALARFNSMGDWLNMRRSLNGIQSLRSIRILALTTNQARMELGYSDWMAFTSSLSARGLALQPMGPGDYALIRNPTGIR